MLTESLAAGTPVITTRGVDIWPEIEGCGGGLIVDRTPAAFADAIDRLLADPRRVGMGEDGRRWVLQELSRERLTERFLSVYRDAAKQKAAW